MNYKTDSVRILYFNLILLIIFLLQKDNISIDKYLNFMKKKSLPMINRIRTLV